MDDRLKAIKRMKRSDKGGRSSSSSQRKSSQAKASVITQLITWFDSYVELYTVDPVKIERSLKGYEGTDIDQIWKSVKGDVDHIIDISAKSDEIEKYAKRASKSRMLSTILALAMLGFLLAYLYLQSRIKVMGGEYILIGIPAIAIVSLYLVMLFAMLSTRSLNRAMRNFYVQHASELSKQKQHIQAATQQLVDRLAREIYSHDFKPEKFKFQLFHTNYKNIAVVGKRGGKFVSTVKPRASTSEK